MKKILISVIALTFAFPIFAKKEVTLLMDWFPQGNQSGFWQAQLDNQYHDDVKIIIKSGGPKVRTTTSVASIIPPSRIPLPQIIPGSSGVSNQGAEQTPRMIGGSKLTVVTPEGVEKIESYKRENPTISVLEIRETLISDSKS